MRAGVSVTRVAMGRVVMTNGYKGTGREREVLAGRSAGRQVLRHLLRWVGPGKTPAAASRVEQKATYERF